MQLYVDELKKIIETMSYTENVANFMDSISELDGVNVDDLEAVAPEIMQKARSNPNSPFASRNTSPTRPPAYMNGYMNGDSGISNENGSFTHQNGYSSTVEQSDDEYIDTVDVSWIYVRPLSICFMRNLVANIMFIWKNRISKCLGIAFCIVQLIPTSLNAANQ